MEEFPYAPLVWLHPHAPPHLLRAIARADNRNGRFFLNALPGCQCGRCDGKFPTFNLRINYMVEYKIRSYTMEIPNEVVAAGAVDPLGLDNWLYRIECDLIRAIDPHGRPARDLARLSEEGSEWKGPQTC